VHVERRVLARERDEQGRYIDYERFHDIHELEGGPR